MLLLPGFEEGEAHNMLQDVHFFFWLLLSSLDIQDEKTDQRGYKVLALIHFHDLEIVAGPYDCDGIFNGSVGLNDKLQTGAFGLWNLFLDGVMGDSSVDSIRKDLR